MWHCGAGCAFDLCAACYFGGVGSARAVLPGEFDGDPGRPHPHGFYRFVGPALLADLVCDACGEALGGGGAPGGGGGGAGDAPAAAAFRCSVCDIDVCARCFEEVKVKAGADVVT